MKERVNKDRRIKYSDTEKDKTAFSHENKI